MIDPRFRGRPVVRRRGRGFQATHLWVHTKPEKTSRDRTLFYASYAAMASVAGIMARRPDVVFASSPPLPVAAAAALVAGFRRVPWVLDVRDLGPAAAGALGELTDEGTIRRLERLERALYSRAAMITTVTEPFRQAIAERSPPGRRIELLPNGTIPLWVEGARLEPSRRDLGLDPTRFIWTFAGNVGLAQGLEAAVDAAALLGDDYELLVIGAGAARPALERRAREGTGRVTFLDQMPPERALLFARASDALLVPLADDPILADFVPSKLYDFCAVGRPVVVAAAGEPQRLVRDAEAALPVAPGRPEALAEALRRLRDDPALRGRLAENGMAFGAAHLRDRQVERLAEILPTVVGA